MQNLEYSLTGEPGIEGGEGDWVEWVCLYCDTIPFTLSITNDEYESCFI